MMDPIKILILYILTKHTLILLFSWKKRVGKEVCTSGGNGRAAHLALPTRIFVCRQKKHTATTNINTKRKKKKKWKKELEREKRFSLSNLFPSLPLSLHNNGILLQVMKLLHLHYSNYYRIHSPCVGCQP